MKGRDGYFFTKITEVKKIVFFFSVIFFVIDLLALATTGRLFSELTNLQNSGYLYSAALAGPTGKDDFYAFDASIPFMENVDDQHSINAFVLMQTGTSDYTDKLNWKADLLASNEIAISAELADRYHLMKGDCLYSTNVVTGDTNPYTIHEILPRGISSRSIDGTGTDRELILMGYDETYTVNLRHRVYIFTDIEADRFEEVYGMIPEILVYRDEEAADHFLHLMPYLLEYIALTVLLCIAFVYLQKKSVSHYLRRLITLGHRSREVNRLFSSNVLYPGLAAVLIGTLLSGLLTLILSSLRSAAAILFLNFAAGILAMSLASVISRKRLWRT